MPGVAMACVASALGRLGGSTKARRDTLHRKLEPVRLEPFPKEILLGKVSMACGPCHDFTRSTEMFSDGVHGWGRDHVVCQGHAHEGRTADTRREVHWIEVAEDIHQGLLALWVHFEVAVDLTPRTLAGQKAPPLDPS